MDVNTANQSASDEQMMDILLVLDKEKKTISAVKGVDENGELKTVPPENNGELLKFDRHGDFFSNFFTNMMNQLKNPTRFSFFRVPKMEVPKIEPMIRDNFANPTTEKEAAITPYRVDPEKVKQEVKQEQQPKQQPQEPPKENATQEVKPSEANKYQIDPQKVNWDELKKLGITKEQLEKSKALEPMLRGYKSPSTFPIAANFGAIIMKYDARLSFRHDKDGGIVLALHGIRKEPELDRPFFSHQFTEEDKKNLRETGNMGRIATIKNYMTGEMIPSFISIDRQTNELVSMNAKSIKIPDEIKGIKLDDKQKAALQEGKPVFLENMISNKNKPFSAFVQVNADRKSLEFIFPKEEQNQRQYHSQQQGQQHNTGQQVDNTSKQQGVSIPQSISGIEITKKQQDDLRADKTIYVQGLKDRKGVEYNAYIKVNHEQNKLDFFQYNPDKARSKAKEITPASESRTQVAVNSEGKTNEATKKVNEPLKQGQAKPTGEQKSKQKDKEVKQENKQKTPQKRNKIK